MKKELIVQIICDKEVGTAFYVAPDLLLTAYHAVASFKGTGNNIIKDSYEGDLKFEVKNVYEDIDMAILKVTERKKSEYLTLLSHRIRIGEGFVSYGYPDTTKNKGLRIKGRITQPISNSTGDFKLRTEDVDESFDYQGISGAPVFLLDDVVGFVIEQDGGSLNLVSVRKLAELLKDDNIPIKKEANLTNLPDSIAKNVESAHPNYKVIGTIDESLANVNNKWVLLYGTPGCGKTTLLGGYKPEDKSIIVLGRFFFKVPNDPISRAIRCSEGYFVDWLESVFISIAGDEVELLTTEEKRKRVPNWFQYISDYLTQRKQQGLLLIDGLDELASDNGYRVDEILSLIPDCLPDNIRIIISCITEEILPAYIIGKLQTDGRIEVTALDIAACETFIKENSGDWEKPYSFIQAVAQKTEGHPLYMNYLCRYIVDSFDSTTKEKSLNEWVGKLPSIGGDIRSYYEAVWKKADPKGCAFEILALLSQTRGAVNESQLINMMKVPQPYEFKSSTKEFRHLMKTQETGKYEIYHSSFRLFISEKLSTIIRFTNDQIATYCETNNDSRYAIENYLHHVVNGQDVKKGISLCNQEWADNCALLDVPPDLVMHDIKECLSNAVNLGISIEVIRLMLLAQRIETRCDSIMVDNVRGFVDLNIALGKPNVALKYIVRDNILLLNLEDAMCYLHLLLEMGYREQAFILADSIEAEIRKIFSDTFKKGINPYIFAAKGFLIVERILAGVEDPSDLGHYFGTLDRFRSGCDEKSAETMGLVMDMIIAYQLSNQLRAGKKIDIAKNLKTFRVTWNEKLVMLFIKVLALYEEKDSGLHRIGQNEAFNDCLRQIESVLLSHTFTFTKNDLLILLTELVDKKTNVEVIKKLLANYSPKPETFNFRDKNGVDINTDSLQNFYRESLYQAYVDDNMSCPYVHSYCYSDSAWEKYIESLVIRTAYIIGTLYRKRAAKEDYSSVYSYVKEMLDSIDFSFATRVKWKRSYLLPEELIPFVYDKLAEIYCDFFEDKIGDFKTHLISRMPDQLCLYREGCCAVLIRLADIFHSKEKMREMALFLTDEAVKYIVYAVQNRSERCSYLLKICLVYALMNEKEKENKVYRDVLNSSMGPEWYKEAQLGLINAFNETDISLDGEQSAHMAAIFEEASGEMTFQRYVQQGKNQFVGTLVKNSSLADAIAYYKFETLPSPERIVQNAEGWKVDMPQTGEGYDLGANHLIESSAICYLLHGSKQVSSYIRYAVSELFWENWDKMHNDHNYAQLHADIISTLGEQEAIETLIPRMAEYYVNEYNRDGKGDYLSDFEDTNTTEAIVSSFQASLKTNGYIWNRKNKRPDPLEHTERLSEKLEKMSTSKSILDEMRKDIVSPLGSYWYSLEQILASLIKKPDFDKSELLAVISGHFDINVRPSKKQFEKFSWFVGKHKENDADEQMIQFLIWFLVHPVNKVVFRAKKALLWLLKFDNRVINCLIYEILHQSEFGLATVTSDLLLEIATENPSLVLEIIRVENVWKQLCTITNFSVSRNLYKIAKVLSDECGYDDFLNGIKLVIPDTMPNRGDVMMDSGDVMFIEHKIDKLNELQVTGGKEFAKPYLDEVQIMRNNGTIKMLIQSDKYTRRSFYLNYIPKGRYVRTMDEILNKILYGKVDYKRADKVYYTINS